MMRRCPPFPSQKIRCALVDLLPDFPGHGASYSDRQFLSLLKSTLAAQIHWTDSQFASVNSCFLGAYAFGLLFAGRIIDKVGVRVGYAVTLLFWSFAALSHTLVSSVEGFMLARIFLGVSEAGNFPAAIKAIAQWFPSAERAFATTLFNSGANVGAIAAHSGRVVAQIQHLANTVPNRGWPA